MKFSKRFHLTRLSLLLFLFATPFLMGQAVPMMAPVPAWITITPEIATVGVTLPAGTTYRFGDYTNNRWSASVTVTAATTFSQVFFPAGVFPFADPDPGVVKELDVLQTAAPQSISVTNLAVTPAVTVSQVVPGLAPPTTIPVTPGTNYTLTFSGFAPAAGTSQNALGMALVNAPTPNATAMVSGTQMTLNIDGVTFVCTYSQAYTSDNFSMICTVPGS